ncbi:Protein-tyrosine phosphatase [Aphelenchoides avenae]|nr:Protein-tyrosine phosphatase [Aphelenchus avenae]
MEQRVPVVPMEEGRPICTAYMDLVPGRRYEVSAASLSGEVSSTKMFRSKAIEPGFDMKAFGLTVSESHNVLHVEWPQSEVTMLRISDVWAKIVGNDTKLHVKVEPLLGPSTSPAAASKDNRREVDLTPSETKPVHLYTVTSSGIVSTQRFEEFIRITAPVVELRIDKVSKNSAALQVSVANPEDRRFPVSPDMSDCVLNVMVMDEHSLAIYDRSITLQATSMPPIPLEGLRPFHRYVVNSQVVCGQTRGNEQSCPQKIRTMQQINFETRQDRPGPVQNLTVKALNPYSAQLLWWPPALPNGVISHYIIDVKPEDSDEKPWTVNVGAPVNLGPLSNTQPVQAVVDNLIGGQTYRMGVQAVTEAGAGDTPASSENVEVEMPVLAPPRPNLRLDTVPDTIRSSDLTIRYNTAMFNTKHGLLRKIAIIVAQVAENGKINDIVAYTNNSSNDTLTWSQVQRFEVWPPYVAVETPMEPIKRYSPRAINEVLGLDMNCADRPKTQVCNGPLKPGTTYRFKLRLYTAPNLWTDTLYSDVVTTEPLQSGATLRGVLFGLGIFLLCAAFAATVLLLCNRRRCRKGAPAYGGTSYGGRRGADHASSAHYASSKESQWKALKMIMAERAADCLAKLGLDSQSPTSTGMASPISVAGNYGSNGGLAQHFANGDVGVRIIHGGGGLQSPSSQTSSLSGGAAPTQQNGCLTMAAAGSNRVIAANPQNGPFGPSHHRRTCSLRERRTGADQRLERLPSGPPPGQKVLLWTIIKGPNTDKSRAVRICDFPEHVRMMSADSDFRFSEEYEDLRNIGNGQTCIAADCTMNRAKNRFTNILPYDHSRVKLIPTDDEEGSDYINANYIPGFNSRREFIAAQGPLPSTRDHFWRVVWEQQCPAIVALTKCVEKGRDKCHQYWPDNNQRSVLYGDIEVTLMTECIEYEDFTVREMRLTNFAEPNHPARTVLHLHYMAWPDFGVPDHPAGIVRFARLFRSRLPPSPNNKPTIVHCSAGVGRSGTFIALDRLVQHIECGRPIDVFGTVYEMRLERCHMVQNEQQYIFIHHCLMYVLENFFPQLIASGAGGMSLPTSQSGFNFPAVNGSAASGNGGGGHHAHAHPYSQVVNGADSLWISSATKAPRIEVHQNPAFLEDDEGIAESGL